MLNRFFNPRWQHPDSEIRRQAIAELRWAKDADAIAQVAREDELPALRRMALRQCLALDLLLERLDSDPDPALRKESMKRYRHMLAGLVDGGPALAERLQRASRVDDVSLLEFLAREGTDDALRAYALARVERESVLRDVALKDPSPALRLEALERIQDEGVLARVYEQSRKNDKQISHRARERLQASKAQRELPQRVAAQCLQILATLESLGRDGHWNRDETRFAELERVWQSLEPRYREEHEQRFASVASHFREKLVANQNAGHSIRADMEALIARLRNMDETPPNGKDAISTRIEELELLLRETATVWKRIERLPDVEEQSSLDQQFLAATQALQASIALQRRMTKLSDLRVRYDRLVARKGAIGEAEVKTLKRERDALPRQPVSEALLKLESRIDKVHRKLRDRLREQASWKEETLAALTARLDALKTAVADGPSSEAIALHDALASDLEALRTIGASKERMTKHQSRLRALGKDVQVMRAWDRFGAMRVLENLCEQMEALKESKEQPPQIASKIRAARDAWREQSAKGPGADQKLWKRFDTAATEAYLPCKAFFEDRAKERRDNLQRRRQLVAELKSLLEAASGRPGDEWKKIVRARGELLSKWHRAHPVERKGAKVVAEQFDSCMLELDMIFERERERSLRHREQLILAAEALAANPDKKATAEACKQLQRQWTTTVPGSRSLENTLWKRFKSACDLVFAERQQVFDDERGRVKAAVEARKILCQQVEALLTVEAGGVGDAERELSRARREWAQIMHVPGHEGDALESRFTALARRFETHKRALSIKAKQAGLEIMRSKAMLCHEAESQLNPLDGATSAPNAEEWRNRWRDLSALADEQAEASLRERFEQALAAHHSTGDASGDDADSRLANLQTLESLCLRLEILVGIDSPVEYAQERMALQVQRLSSALKERKDAEAENADDLLRAWCLSGPAPTAHAQALEARFSKAWMAKDDSLGEQTDC